ncbi:scarecrow-like protein 30 [Impatiens glandulifera]|uniref:scarecrow-like protein 30 n=1 Tax=Impatiens glandulifera TaxID=253017 RepID=UPI001FB0A7E0|nr:scarecrow-like protein 30 [Impatiens glandulifera]
MDDDVLGDGPDSHHFSNKSSCGGLSCENVSSEAANSFKFINQVLMDDDDNLENIDNTCMIQESILDATEKSLYDVLYNNSIVLPSHEALLYIQDNDDSFHTCLNGEGDNLLLKEFDNSSVQWNYINSLDHGQNPSENQKDHLLPVELIENVSYDLHQVEDNDLGEMRNKNMSSDDAEPWLVELFSNAKSQSKRSTSKGNCPTRKRKKEAVDLRALLLKCMEYLLLKSDRQGAKLLLAYQQWFAAFPLLKTSNFVAAEKIVEIADKADTIHLIHFGKFFNLHLPPIIQRLSKRPGRSPKLRITGIDLYESGPYPDAKQIGHLLEKYCEKLNIPFECNGVALNWKTLSIDDLKMKGDELSVAVCLFSMQFVPDDTILEVDSQRDGVLNLIKRISPDIFIHGTINGTYNSPFLISRFREALFYFSIYFDIYDTILPIDDPDRTFYEEMAGRHIFNNIACEGLKRIDRPETYRQWNSRL